MNFTSLFVALIGTYVGVDAISINHDRVLPFGEPVPVTEKAAVKFKPQFAIKSGCTTYPAVNAAGETTGGLAGSSGTHGCTDAALLGSQVYGRSMWYNDVWAIMYAWYFPKAFWDIYPSRRHYWSSVVIWIDNPAFESPKVLGLSTSIGDDKYENSAPDYEKIIAETGIDPTDKKLTLVQSVRIFGPPFLKHSAYYNTQRGAVQNLIMWEQLTEEARTALNTTDFGKPKVPSNDANFQDKLEKARPF